MSIVTPATTTTATTGEPTAAKAEAPCKASRHTHLPAVAGNANLRALLGQGIHEGPGRRTRPDRSGASS
ncbi:hypothetical protein ABZ368_11410 [Streptomyces sp. NPDC005908]|uniref:hypothetical protein n=1 Tax=unclassified Streptomyces TaxID=2593676 RepID=UPI0033D5C6D5